MQAAHKTREENEDLVRVPSHKTFRGGAVQRWVEEIRLSEGRSQKEQQKSNRVRKMRDVLTDESANRKKKVASVTSGSLSCDADKLDQRSETLAETGRTDD